MTREILKEIASNYSDNSVVRDDLSQSDLLSYINEAISLAIESYQQEQLHYQEVTRTRPTIIKAYPETAQMLMAISSLSRSLELYCEDFTKQNSGIPWSAFSNLVKNIYSIYKPVHGLASSVVIETNPDYQLCCNFIEQIASNDLPDLQATFFYITNHQFFSQSFPVAVTTRKIDEFLSSEKQFGLIKDSSNFIFSSDISQLLTSKEGRVLLLRHIGVIGEGFSALEANLRKRFKPMFVSACRMIRNGLDHPEAEFNTEDQIRKTCLELKNFVEKGDQSAELKILFADLSIFQSENQMAIRLMEDIHGYRHKEYRVRPYNSDDNVHYKKRRVGDTDEEISQVVWVSKFPDAIEIISDRAKYIDEFYDEEPSMPKKIHFLFYFQNKSQGQKYSEITTQVIAKLVDHDLKESSTVSADNINEIILYLNLFRNNFLQANHKPQEQRSDFEKQLIENYCQIQRVYNFKIKKIIQKKSNLEQGKNDAEKRSNQNLKRQFLSQYLEIIDQVTDFARQDDALLQQYQSQFIDHKVQSPCRKIDAFFNNIKPKNDLKKIGNFQIIEVKIGDKVKYFKIDQSHPDLELVLKDLYRINNISLYQVNRGQLQEALDGISENISSSSNNTKQKAKNAIENLQALILSCEQAIEYQVKISRLFRPVNSRAAERLSLLNRYQEGHDLLRELGGESFIFESDFSRDDVDNFMQFFDGLSEEQKQRISDFSASELSHKANLMMISRRLQPELPMVGGFNNFTLIPNHPTLSLDIDGNNLTLLHCNREFYQINAGSYARALLGNEHFMESLPNEVRSLLDNSLRVVRGYLAHNADQRLGAGDEVKMHSSYAGGSEIAKMQENLPQLKQILGSMNVDDLAAAMSKVVVRDVAAMPNLADLSISTPSPAPSKPIAMLIDEIQNEGNLTMGQTHLIFERLIRQANTQLTDQDDIVRMYGGISWYSDEIGARNSALNQEIINFISGIEPSSSLAIGDNRTLILLRAESLRNLGTENEQPNFGDPNATHYTVLNLIRESDGSIVFRYSDSIGNANNNLNPVPTKLKRILEDNGINTHTKQRPFTSQQQGATANCGYAAVYNALRMHDIQPPQIDFDRFVVSQRQILMEENSRLGRGGSGR